MLSNHVSHFMSGSSFLPEAKKKGSIQLRVGHNVICATFITVCCSYSINSGLSTSAHRDILSTNGKFMLAMLVLGTCCETSHKTSKESINVA